MPLSKKQESAFTLPEDLTKIAPELCSEPNELHSVDIFLILKAQLLLSLWSDFDEAGAWPSGGASSQLGHINGRTCNWHHSGTRTPSKRRRMAYTCGGHDPQNQLWVSLRSQQPAPVPRLVSASQPPGAPRREPSASMASHQMAAAEQKTTTLRYWQTTPGQGCNHFLHLALNLPHHQNDLGPARPTEEYRPSQLEKSAHCQERIALHGPQNNHPIQEVLGCPFPQTYF